MGRFRTIVYSILAVFLLTGCSHRTDVEIVPEPVEEEKTITKVCASDSCWEVEVADDREERMIGLMGRKDLASGSGMLFVFDEVAGKRKFWMKNTWIPLDMLRLDEQGKIVYIHENARPCTMDPCPTYGPESELSLYVLELNGGTVETIGLVTGDELQFTTKS